MLIRRVSKTGVTLAGVTFPLVKWGGGGGGGGGKWHSTCAGSLGNVFAPNYLQVT